MNENVLPRIRETEPHMMHLSFVESQGRLAVRAFDYTTEIATVHFLAEDEETYWNILALGYAEEPVTVVFRTVLMENTFDAMLVAYAIINGQSCMLYFEITL